MIFRLDYCNKASVTARVDIQKGGATPIYTVEGTAEPFVLFYNNDKGDKSGSFRSSGADINIYETTEFNIDELKTSNETEISVKYYINNILNWSGFVIPDFFSETITGGKGVVSMVASDRLGTLKGATLSGLSAKVSNMELAEACLSQTGLSLPLYTMANFTGDGTNIFNSEVLSQRMVDTKGRNVSCYDILSSILAETNSLIVQRNGAWYIVNNLQLEAGSGSLYSSPVTSSAWVENTVSFDEVSVGARRTITPVAATVGVYHEHGGGRLHPDNYDFSAGSTGWIPSGGFPFTIATNQIKQYEKVGSTWNVEFGDSDRNRMQINKQWDGLPANLDIIQYASNSFPVVTTSDDSVTVGIDISVTGNPLSIARFTILAEGDGKRFAFNPSSGVFEEYDPLKSEFIISISPSGPYLGDNKYDAANEAIVYSAKLNVENISDYNISIRVYGTNIPILSGGGFAPMFVDFASVKFGNTAEAPKGNIFKTTQGANYTKDHEIPTVLWGDYLTYGLNGYFYSYPIDDTSSLYRPTGELHSRWTAYGDPDTLPLLQHITRQKARMFSVAHDLLSADIETSTFDPLSIFVDCDSTRYVVVSARFDFLRSNVSVELEEIAYVTNSKRDYIYSYFGDGEEGISSIGGISGGSGGSVSGGGLTTEQLLILNNLASWWKLDEVNDAIYSEKSVYSQQEVSAYGIGSGGSGGGGDISKLPSWAGYTPAMVDYYVSAGLLVPFYNDMQSRVSDLEGGVPPTQHNHIIGDVIGLQDALDGKVDDSQVLTNVPANAKFTDTIYTHPASHPISFIDGLQSALDGKVDDSQVLTNVPANAKFTDTIYTHPASHPISFIDGLQSALDGKVDDSQVLTNVPAGAKFTDTIYTHPTSHPISMITGLQTALNLKLNKSVFDDLFEKVEVSTGVYAIKAKYDFYSIGGVSAYGLGSGGSGGGGIDISKLQSWAGYTSAMADYYVPASLLVPFYNDYNSHGHVIGDVTGLQSVLDLKATQSDIDTAIDGIEIGGRNLIIKSATTKGYYNNLGVFISASDAWISDFIEVSEGKEYTAKSFNSTNNVGGQLVYFDADKTYITRAEWLRVEETFVIPTGVGYIRYQSDKVGGVYVDDAIIVKGNKATDWTPAPEDTEREILESQGFMKARYIRDYLNGNSANTNNYWVQIKALNKVGTNIALNKPVTASGTVTNLARVTNGSLDGYDYAQGTGFQYVQIDLGQVYYDIDYIHVWRYYLEAWTFNGTKTQISEDGITWKTIFDSDVSGTYVETEGGKVHIHKGLDDKLNITGGTLSGNLTAPTFIGALSGNALTATTATTATNLSGGTVSATTGTFSSTLSVTGVLNSGGLTYSKAINKSGVDANTLTLAGFYDGQIMINMPNAGWFYLHVQTYSAGSQWCQQTAISFGSDNTANRRYSRNNVNGIWTTWSEIAYLTDNVASATKLQTARTIWGQSFNGTANVTGALTGATTIAASTSVTAPKVIFSAAGWSLEQVGTELQMKYNGAAKMRFLSGGSIVATSEITAYS